MEFTRFDIDHFNSKGYTSIAARYLREALRLLEEKEQELKKVNDFIRDIGKLLGEDNLGFDGISWSTDDFKNAIDQEKRKEATNFLVFCRRKAKSLESDPLEWGVFDRLCADQKYDLYLQSLTQHVSNG